MSDHTLINMGLYIVPHHIPISRRDIYMPVFAVKDYDRPLEDTAVAANINGDLTAAGTSVPSSGFGMSALSQRIRHSASSRGRNGANGSQRGSDGAQHGADASRHTVVCFDFFSGHLNNMLYLIAHLYVALVFPNCIKRVLINNSWLYQLWQGIVRILVLSLQVLSQAYNTRTWQAIIAWAKRRLPRWLQPWFEFRLVTAILKFSPAEDGEYEFDDTSTDRFGLRLPLFAQGDVHIAENAVSDLMRLLGAADGDSGVAELSPWTKAAHLLNIQLPVDQGDVPGYVQQCRTKFALTEQHLAGGCQRVVTDEGKYKHAENLFVADLSSITLPRISPQMTAYLIGVHVAKQLAM